MGNYTFENLNSFFHQTNEINLNHYSQKCSDNHLCKMTTRPRQPMLSPPKKILIQSLLYKMTTCLVWPSTNFFLSPKWKKAYLKQPLKNFIQQRNGKQHEKQYIKNKRLCLYLLHCYSLMLSLFNVYKSWTNYKII